jgi:hypothetical protein
MTSKNGGSLMIGFSGTIHGRLNYMPVMYEGQAHLPLDRRRH